MAARTLPLRRLLILLGLLGAGYVVAIVVYLQFFMLPTTVSLRTDTEVVLEAQADAADRLADLDVALTGVGGAVQQAAGGAVPAEGVMDDLEARIDAVLMSTTGLGLTARLVGVPDSVRIGLAGAAAAETSSGERLIAALAALREGDQELAERMVSDAGAQRQLAEVELARAETMAISEVIRRERDLEATVGGAVLVLVAWGLVGSALVVGAFLILRVRLYRPLAAIESSLKRIADGDLSTSVDIDRDDEMGRLAGMLNRMTAVLADRERREQERRQTVIERYSRILEESASELVAFDAATFRAPSSRSR